MTFEARLKSYRKEAGLSQEKLAELIGVSRQAITKWETGAGAPDLSNLVALAELFGVSVDEMLSGEKGKSSRKDYLYESMTGYDIDAAKHYDIKLGGANKVVIAAADCEKLTVRAVSNTIADIERQVKIKIDDAKNHLDIDLNRSQGLSETKAKEALTILITLPQNYVRGVELELSAKSLELYGICCDDIEVGGKIAELLTDGCEGEIEIDCNADMSITVLSHRGAIEVNQIGATSRITVPGDYAFKAARKGLATHLYYETQGAPAEDFSQEEAENYIELNGVKSELVIARE